MYQKCTQNVQKWWKNKSNIPVFGIIVEKSFFWCQIKFSSRFFCIFQRSTMFGIFSTTELRTKNVRIASVVIICAFLIFILLSSNINAHTRLQNDTDGPQPIRCVRGLGQSDVSVSLANERLRIWKRSWIVQNQFGLFCLYMWQNWNLDLIRYHMIFGNSFVFSFLE